MKILSIHDGHNASVALLEDGVVRACISEERLNREKFYWGFPHLALSWVLDDAGVSLTDVDVVTVSHLSTWAYIKRQWELATLASLRPKVLYGLIGGVYRAWKRERKVRALFNTSPKKPIFYFCDHHVAHAAGAYYHSGFSKALVVTLDALGDSYSHTAWEVEGATWKRLAHGGSNESLGSFYETVTKGLGFTPNKHEGKVVGLAAYADPHTAYEDAKGLFVNVSTDGMHFTRTSYAEMGRAVQNLLTKYTREEVASVAQKILEDSATTHISALLEKTDTRNVAVAGGVFANVKMNQRIVEQCTVEHLFVEPPMGDEGLVLGAALYYENVIAKRICAEPLRHVYYGTHFDTGSILALLKGEGLRYEKLKDCAKQVATLIDDGKVVGWFEGRMEFGPRALGKRSILVRPIDHKINDEINKRLKRSEFMPFAPSALYEYADEVFEGVGPSRHAAEFMTITYMVKEKWREKMRAVVHVDGTARPQLVRKEVNPTYYAVIEAYYKRTGIPLVVNTSFNMHEEPIVSSPQDALRSLRVGAVDCVVFNGEVLVWGV